MNNYGYASWGKSRGCVSEYLGEDVVETEEKRIKLPNIIYRVSVTSQKLIPPSVEKKMFSLVDWNLFTKTNSFIRVFVVTICKKDLNICLDPITSWPE